MKYYIETILEFAGLIILMVIFTVLAVVLIVVPCIMAMWVYKTLFGG